MGSSRIVSKLRLGLFFAVDSRAEQRRSTPLEYLGTAASLRSASATHCSPDRAVALRR
jgi:hypothetical protein